MRSASEVAGSIETWHETIKVNEYTIATQVSFFLQYPRSKNVLTLNETQCVQLIEKLDFLRYIISPRKI